MSNSAMVQAFSEVDKKVGSVIQSQAEKLDHRSTFRMSVKMRASYLDVERIVANWTVEEKAAPEIAAGVRFQDAYRRGDFDYIRENYPLLFTEQMRRPKPSQKKSEPLFKDSDSGSDSMARSFVESENENKKEKEGGAEEIAIVLEEITGADRRFNRKVDKLARTLQECSYTATDVRDWHSRWWLTQDWRGKRGDAPEMEHVQKFIRLIKSLPPLPAALPPAVPESADESANEIPAQVDEVMEYLTPTPSRPTMMRGWGVDQWCKLIMQLQSRLNRATFDAHLQRIRLLKVQQGEPSAFTVAVPHAYARDWITQNLLPAMRAELSAICLRLPPSTLIDPTRLVVIEIEIEPQLERIHNG